MGSWNDDPDVGLHDAAVVLGARREVDPLLAALIVQPFDAAAIEALTAWLLSTYPAARGAYLRLQRDGRRSRFTAAADTDPALDPGPALRVVPGQ